MKSPHKKCCWSLNREMFNPPLGGNSVFRQIKRCIQFTKLEAIKYLSWVVLLLWKGVGENIFCTSVNCFLGKESICPLNILEILISWLLQLHSNMGWIQVRSLFIIDQKGNVKPLWAPPPPPILISVTLTVMHLLSKKINLNLYDSFYCMFLLLYFTYHLLSIKNVLIYQRVLIFHWLQLLSH